MDVLNIIYYCAVILLATKIFGMLSRRIGLPQVVGMILAGLLIGPAIISRFGWSFHGLIDPSAAEMNVLSSFSQIGVIFILFSSGLETDFRKMKKSGAAATAIAFVDRKVIVSGYMIFTPMFFAYIGISADFSHFTAAGLLFAVVFVFLGIIGKILGCSVVSRFFHYKGRDSIGIGCGMIARGEVALAVYATGQSLIYYGEDGALLGIDPLVATIFLIVTTSVLCPILLKLCFRNTDHPSVESPHTHTRISAEAIENIMDDGPTTDRRAAQKLAPEKS